MHELDKTGLEAAKTAYRIAEEHPEMTACTRCAGKGYVHGFGEYGYDPDWCPSCGGPGFELVQGEEDRPLREAISAYLSSTSAGVTEEQTPRVTDYWHSVDTAPEDEWVILATSGEHVGQALMLVDEDTGQQAWSWYGGNPVHPNLKPLGWRHMPSPLFTEILPDNRPGGFDGPTGAE